LINDFFIPIDAQPVQYIKNSVYPFLARTLDICIFNSQQELTLLFSGEKVIEQCGVRATDMQQASWAGRETNTKRTGHFKVVSW